LQNIPGTLFAERAFKGTDHRAARIRRQILVATLTSRPHFQHFVLPTSFNTRISHAGIAYQPFNPSIPPHNA
jgi:hypothetical protein